jgi:hypothetical protein
MLLRYAILQALLEYSSTKRKKTLPLFWQFVFVVYLSHHLAF